jgi:diguanylate cyclase (GGDEF)-like protein/PAS domain S-box-containing protein
MAVDGQILISSLRATLGKMEVALDSIAEAIAWTDGAGKVQWCNTTCDHLVGKHHFKVLGATLVDLLPLEQQGSPLSTEEHPVNLILNGEFEASGTYEFRQGDKRLVLEISGACAHFSEHEKSAVLAIRDITEHKRVQARLDELAHFDPLTGLPNRRLFTSLLSQSMARARRAERLMALLFIDLDHFKLINDTLGHGVGDRLLQAVPQRLTGCLRTNDTLARLGGDELTLILEDINSPEEVTGIVRRIQEIMAPVFTLDGREVFVTCSIGIALYPTDTTDGDGLIQCADTAMYAAKERRGAFRFYSADMHSRTMERLTIETGLRLALQRNEFLLHYQPLVESSSRTIVGMEALIRWQHPERGLLFPDAFIAIAEETKLIVSIEEWVLRTACAQTKAWQAMGFPRLRVAVNLSLRQFEQPDLVQMVARVLQDTGLEASRLELELTERLLIEDRESIMATLHALNEMGVHLAIDDFGTEYSALNYLRRLPISSLKIDKSFIREILTNSDDASIVKALVAMAHCLKLKVIAEGVETEEQASFLQAHHCNEMQGYHFSRAVPADQFMKLMTTLPRCPVSSDARESCEEIMNVCR